MTFYPASRILTRTVGYLFQELGMGHCLARWQQATCDPRAARHDPAFLDRLPRADNLQAEVHTAVDTADTAAIADLQERL